MSSTTESSSKLVLYGVPLSQPFRSVVWTLLIKHVPFTIQVTVPGIDATNKASSRNENFTKLSNGRTNLIPILRIVDEEKDSSFTIIESPAILTYICEKYCTNPSSPGGGDSDNIVARNLLLPPPATKEKSMVDSYMHWHHTNTRRCLTRLTAPTLLPHLLGLSSISENHMNAAKSTLQSLNDSWLGDNANVSGGGDVSGSSSSSSPLYVAGTDTPTIADILAYEEIMQVKYIVSQDILDDIQLSSSSSSYTNVWNWMERMKQTLPYHEQVHKGLHVFHELSNDNNTGNGNDDNNNGALPLNKRLAIANKAALQAINEAQQTYQDSSSMPSSKL